LEVGISVLDRIILLITSLLAAYQVAVGIDGLGGMAITSYTIGFGVLLVAALLILIMGFDVLDSPLVAIVSTLIPLSLSLGLVADHVSGFTIPYLIFVLVGLVAIITTRYIAPGVAATLVLALFHGVAGVLIFLLPLILSLRGITPLGFAWVGIGGGLIGLGGLLLSFLKAGSPLLSRQKILTLFPGLLLLTTACFVAGFAFI
jgi:hypothetical protein